MPMCIIILYAPMRIVLLYVDVNNIIICLWLRLKSCGVVSPLSNSNRCEGLTVGTTDLSQDWNVGTWTRVGSSLIADVLNSTLNSAFAFL